MGLIKMTAAAIAFAALSACSSSGTEPTVANQLTGDWYESLTVPGSGLSFKLTVVDTTISGSGTFSIEAGQSGTTSVTGVISAGHVKLTIARSLGDTLHFDGVVTDPYDLDGFGYYAGPGLPIGDPASVTFMRPRPVD
jgi:hypothetical protein